MSKSIQMKTKDNEKVYPHGYFPVGFIYLSVVNENPSKYFDGTWELLCPGKTLVCVDTSDTDFNQVKKTGGEKTHKLTIDEMPSHQHDMNDDIYGGYLNKMGVRGDGGGGSRWVPQYSQTDSYSKYIPMHAGGSHAHNNLQPYMTCYMWVRTK